MYLAGTPCIDLPAVIRPLVTSLWSEQGKDDDREEQHGQGAPGHLHILSSAGFGLGGSWSSLSVLSPAIAAILYHVRAKIRPIG